MSTSIPGAAPLRPLASSDSSSSISRSLQPATTFFAIGLVGLGVLALKYGDFAMVWQPVPDWLPARTAVAYASGGLMVFLGVAILVKAIASWSSRILLVYLFLWALLKVPAIAAAPGMEAVWLGLGELTVLLAGGWTLFCRLSKVSIDSPWRFIAGDRGIRAARIMFAISVIPIGLSHLFYVKATVDLVPAWLPFRTGWAYVTGIGHIAAGLAVLLSVLPWLAATAEAAMIGVFTLLVWLPAIVHAPNERLNWTAFFISWIIAAAVWAVAQEIPRKRSG